jgi:hypothetical protein
MANNVVLQNLNLAPRKVISVEQTFFEALSADDKAAEEFQSEIGTIQRVAYASSTLKEASEVLCYQTPLGALNP